jgi:hypothetical protein
MKIISGLELAQTRHPEIAHHVPELLAVGTPAERHVEHVGAGLLGPAVGVERMLEGADHQHARVALEAVFGAIAVVHVEIDTATRDRCALRAHAPRRRRCC